MKRVFGLLSVIVVFSLALSALSITSSGVNVVKALGVTAPHAAVTVYDLDVTGTYSYVANNPAMSIATGLTAISTPSGGTIDGAIVLIGTGFQTGDTLSATASGGVTSSYSAASGVLTLLGTADISVYQTVLETVKFSTSSTNTSVRTVSYALGAARPYATNGHYYQYILSSVSWATASTAASASNYFGRTGYLATITDANENSFANTKLNGNSGWLGGADAAVENQWRWITGPEAGTLFCTDTISGADGCSDGGQYDNWDTGEPNNFNGNEDYLQFIGGGSGKWNDLAGIADPGPNTYNVNGYVIEYGDMVGDSPMDVEGSVTVNVSPAATATATATATNTATATETATATATATETDVPPTSTATATLVPATSTSTATNTLVPPTSTATATSTNTTVPATATRTATATNTPNVSPFAVTINQAAGQVDPTTTRLLSFTAVFAEAVTGFTAADVDVVLNASTTCAPTVTVTGSGTTYNVALTLMRNECTATVTIPAGGANSIARPGAVNSASTSTDNAQTFHYIKKYYFSQAVNDGWILESGVATNVGGTMSNVGDTMSVGDDASNRELRIFSRFDTTADPVPANATIAVVNYRIKQVPGSSLGNVFTARGNLISELNKPYFGTAAALELADFQNPADSGACNFDTTILADGFYRCVFFQVSINLFPKGGGFINMRSRFATQDTNNTADQLTVYTGDYSYQYSKPQLFVAYFFEPVLSK